MERWARAERGSESGATYLHASVFPSVAKLPARCHPSFGFGRLGKYNATMSEAGRARMSFRVTFVEGVVLSAGDLELRPAVSL